MLRVLSREGVDPKVLGQIFNAVVQAVFLSRVETWVLTSSMDWSLSIFQHRVVQRLARRKSRRQGSGSWYYPPLMAAMAERGFKEIDTYVMRS